MPDAKLQSGHGIKTQSGKVYKITKVLNDKEVECKNAHPKEPDEVTTLSTDQIMKLLTPHQLGQVKRFLPGGTGFSKLGRKLQNSHTKESVVESFLHGEIGGEELVEQSMKANSIGDTISQIADDEIDQTVKDTVASIISNNV